jgi:hypothetical protein
MSDAAGSELTARESAIPIFGPANARTRDEIQLNFIAAQLSS